MIRCVLELVRRGCTTVPRVTICGDLNDSHTAIGDLVVGLSSSGEQFVSFREDVGVVSSGHLFLKVITGKLTRCLEEHLHP